MKHYAGLDISMKTTNVCIVDGEGKIVHEAVRATNPDSIAKSLYAYRDSLDIVGLESGAMCFWLVDELRDRGFPASCLDARKVSDVLSTIINKTDKNDARGIAQILRSKFYTIVHQKSKESVEIGALMTLRSGLVNDRTQKKNRIRGILKGQGIGKVNSTGHHMFVECVKTIITGFDSRTKLVIEIALDDYVLAERGISRLEEEVEKAAKNNPVVSLLTTVPGVGPITALSFVAEIDDPTRFKKSLGDVGAYLGLTPRQYSSGESVRLGGISQAGSSSLRSLLYEAAVVLLTRTKSWSRLKKWGLDLAKRMPFKKAATAVARKLSVILLKMWLRKEAFKFSKPKEEDLIENKKSEKIKSKKKADLLDSSEQPRPILTKRSDGIKAKPFGLASLGLDPHPPCLV